MAILRVTAILTVVGSVACVGRLPEQGKDDADGGAPFSSLSCPAADAPIGEFNICFGVRSDPGFVPGPAGGRSLDVDADVTGTLADIPFFTCVSNFPAEDSTSLRSDDNEFRFAIRAIRNDGTNALPDQTFRVGDAVHLSYKSDGGAGSTALRVDDGASHIASTLYGLVSPDVPGLRVERGPPDGDPIVTDCGRIQQDTIAFSSDDVTAFLKLGECQVVGNFVVLAVEAFHPIESVCSDSLATLSWVAIWHD